MSAARLVIIAVAGRLPAWAESACAEYQERMPRAAATRRVQLKPELRAAARPIERVLEAEARRIRAAVPEGARIVALDERGRDLSTAQFAALLRKWLDSGAPTAFVIGGADGLERRLVQQAELALRLSAFTLPHALAQVLLCEQLYRASTLLAGHPYHRA